MWFCTPRTLPPKALFSESDGGSALTPGNPFSPRVAIPTGSQQRLLHTFQCSDDESECPGCELCSKERGAGMCAGCNDFICDDCCVGMSLRGVVCDDCGLMACERCCAGVCGPMKHLDLQGCSGCRLLLQEWRTQHGTPAKAGEQDDVAECSGQAGARRAGGLRESIGSVAAGRPSIGSVDASGGHESTPAGRKLPAPRVTPGGARRGGHHPGPQSRSLSASRRRAAAMMRAGEGAAAVEGTGDAEAPPSQGHRKKASRGVKFSPLAVHVLSGGVGKAGRAGVAGRGSRRAQSLAPLQTLAAQVPPTPPCEGGGGGAAAAGSGRSPGRAASAGPGRGLGGGDASSRRAPLSPHSSGARPPSAERSCAGAPGGRRRKNPPLAGPGEAVAASRHRPNTRSQKRCLRSQGMAPGASTRRALYM